MNKSYVSCVIDRQTDTHTHTHTSDRQIGLSQNGAFLLLKCKLIPRYVQNGPMIILVLVWRKSIHFWRIKYAQKRFLHFRSQWPWPL